MMFRFTIVAFCTLVLLTSVFAEAPQKPMSTAAPANSDDASPQPSRYQMIALEKTVLLLDRISGDTWHLDTSDVVRPRWVALTRQAASATSTADTETQPAERQPIKPQKDAGAKQKSATPLVGPIELSLIPNHDIVILRGPQSSVRAAKEAIQAMSRAHQGVSPKLLETKN